MLELVWPATPLLPESNSLRRRLLRDLKDIWNEREYAITTMSNGQTEIRIIDKGLESWNGYIPAYFDDGWILTVEEFLIRELSFAMEDV